MACFWWRRPSRGKTVVTFVYCLFLGGVFGWVWGGVGRRCNSVLWPALSITISCVGNGDGRTLAPACFKRLPKSWMRLSSLDDKCSASLAIEKMARRSVLKPEKLKNNTKNDADFASSWMQKTLQTQEKSQKTLARRMSSTEMCAKTMRLASNVYHMNAKNRHNVGSVSHPAGCLSSQQKLANSELSEVTDLES